MIRGRKNFLPANQLIAGFGIMFKVHSSCTARHAGERRIRGFGEDASQFEGGDGVDDFSDQSSEHGGSDDETQRDASDAAVVSLTMDAVATLHSGSVISAPVAAGAASVVSESQVKRACFHLAAFLMKFIFHAAFSIVERFKTQHIRRRGPNQLELQSFCW